MKKTRSKILCIFLVIIMLFNFIYPSNSYAAEEKKKTTAWDVLGDAADSVTGILLMPAKLILITVGTISGFVTSQIAEVDAGKNTSGESESVWVLTLEDIFFHNVDKKLPILNVNFFDDTGPNHTVIGGIRNNVAGWYYSIRNLAIIISLLVLIYIGIRMAISTLAEDKATYKKMLTDWIVGFITIFLLHYIIIATVYVNEALVGALKPQSDGSWFSNYMGKILTASLGTISFTAGMGGAIVYTFMAVLTFMFLFTYIKRMLTVAFLIIIAPVITVTYSIDKIGDGKSQALNTWLKEFIYNVLIQPFHCIIYLVFASILATLLNVGDMGVDTFFSGTTLGGGVVAIVIMIFMRQAEDIVRNIFGFNNAKSLGSAVAAGALLAKSIQTAGKALDSSKKSSSSGSKSSSSSGSGSSKPKTSPAVKDTSNVGNTAGSSSMSMPSSSNTQAGSSGSSSSQSSSSGQSSQGSSSQGQSSSANNRQSAVPENSAVDQQQREYNTEMEEAQSRLNRALNYVAKANVKAVEIATGIGVGGAASGDITGMLTAYNFGKAATKATNMEEGIRHPIKSAKTIANKTPIVARSFRTVSKTNDVIDSYNDLKSEKGWSNDKMLTETERVLNINDTSKIRDEKLRTYADSVQNLRQEYEGKYQVPNDMVLDRVTKIQSGEVKKNNSIIFRKKPKTRPIDRGSRPNPNNRGNNRR